MNDSVRCPRCGASLASDAPEGLCPRCLAALPLGPETAFTGAEAAASQPPLSPEKIAPHFPQLEILECLGRGGMGVVYKARQKALNRLVALKLLAPEREKDAEFAERFAREAQALAALSHSHIVTIHDFGQANGFFYLLMEFVDGVNLRQLLQARKLTPEEALAIVPPLCEALQFAHERGIVHRDIKPENLLLAKDGHVKIADFGIAKMLGADAQAAQVAGERAAGTPGYMAPEQKEWPARADSRADIYSLGVVFYEMLTGELPAKKIEPPSRKVQVDVRIDEIVLRALEKEPELRFQTADEVRAAVTSVTEGRAEEREPIEPAAGSQPPDEKWMRLVGYLLLVPGIPLAIFGLIMLRLVLQDPDWNPSRNEAVVTIGSWAGAILLLGTSAMLLWFSPAAPLVPVAVRPEPAPPPGIAPAPRDPWPRRILRMLGLLIGLPMLLFVVGLLVPWILLGHDRAAVNSVVGWLIAVGIGVVWLIVTFGLLGSWRHRERTASEAGQTALRWRPVAWAIVALIALPALLLLLGLLVPAAQRSRSASAKTAAEVQSRQNAIRAELAADAGSSGDRVTIKATENSQRAKAHQSVPTETSQHSAGSQEVQGLVQAVKQVTVSSPAPQEVITAVHVKEGDKVKEGDVLVQLGAIRDELAVERAQKEIQAAEVKAKEAQDTGSKDKEVEAHATLELARLHWLEAQAALKEKTVRSPLSGIVIKQYKEAGESLERGEKLVDVANIDEVYVQFYLDPKRTQQWIKLEQPVKVRFPALPGNEEFTGNVSFIDPQIDPTHGLSQIKVLINNPNHRLKAGMRGWTDFGLAATR